MADRLTFLPLILLNNQPITIDGIGSDNSCVAYCASTDEFFEITTASYLVGLPGSATFIASYDGLGVRLNRVRFDNGAACPVSGHVRVWNGHSGQRQVVVNPSGTHLFAVCGDAILGGAKLSKFDTTTLLEVATANLNTGSGGVDDLPMGTFSMGGLEYLAIQEGPNKVEIFRCDTLASVGAFNVNNNAFLASDEFLLVGEQSGTQQTLYLIASVVNRMQITKVVFDSSGPSMSVRTTVVDKVPTDVESHWNTTGANGFFTTFPVFDHSDNSIIVLHTRAGGTNPSADAGVTGDGFLVKYKLSDGSFVWKLAVPGNVSLFAAQTTASGVNGTLRYLPGPNQGNLHGATPSFDFTYPWNAPDATSGPCLVINTADATYTVEYYTAFARTTTTNGQRGLVYEQSIDKLFFYDVDGVEGNGNGWGGMRSIPVIFGGTTVCLESVLDLFRPQVYNLCKKSVNSNIEIGPFRFAEQKEADETSKIDTLIIGLSQAAIDDDIEYDDYSVDVDETDDWMTMVDLFGAAIFEDWGFESDDEDLFSLELMATDDGISPQFQGVEALEVIEDKGSTKQYVPQGYSAIFHRLKFSATNVGESFYLKFVDIAGSLTGRHR